MKKTFLAKLLAGFSGVALLTYGVMLACGPDFSFDFRDQSNFTPEIFVDEADLPLMLSSFLFYENGALPSKDQFDGYMVADWTEYLKGVADPEVVRYFLLDSSRQAVNALYLNKGVPKIKGNFDRQSKKGRDFIQFLYLAKQVESASISHRRWNYHEIHYKQFDDEKTIGQIESIYQTTPDKFLKKRYWFQTLKAYFYSTDRSRAIKFFEANQTGVEKDLLYYRGMAYAAGAYYRQQEYAKSNYLFSIIFGNCPALRQMAMFNFHPQEQEDWLQTLAMTKTKEEKAAVWAMHGYYADELEAIENIFKLHPKSKDLEFLLARLINNIEVSSPLADPTYGSFTHEPRDFSKAAKLVSDIAKSGKTTKPEIWNLAAGYLWTINRDFKKSISFYDLAARKLSDSISKSQLRLLRLVDAVSQLEAIDKSSEDKLLPELNWLLLDLPSSSSNGFRYENAVGWVRQTMANLYQKAENPVVSEMYVRREGFYLNPKHRAAMKAFMEKPKFTQYEALMVKIYPVSLEQIYHYEAVAATLADRIPDAIALMKRAGEAKDYKFLGDPFLGTIQDCHDCDHGAPKKREYSHLQFIEEVAKIQGKIQKLEDVYTNSILLGNAFYNITHFGNGRTFYEDEIFGFSYHFYQISDKERPLMQNIYDSSLAEKYYRQALVHAKTDEQKAKCHYLLAKCERNDYYNETFGPGGYAGYGIKNYFLAWDGFKALEQFPSTKYYRDVIRECGYFRTYINGK